MIYPIENEKLGDLLKSCPEGFEESNDQVIKFYGEQRKKDTEMLFKVLESCFENSKTRFAAYVAKVLKKLMEMRSTKQTRPISNWLKKSPLALVAVPKEKTFKFILSLYLDHCKPPSRNEVLIVSGTTTTEDVELFMNRAMSDNHSVYCMSNCHLLDSDKCKIVQKNLGEAKPCHIVFVYHEEISRCEISLYLKKYKVTEYKIADDRELKDFVDKLLKSDLIPLDGGHSARLIKSTRPGLGKSLCVSNLKKGLKNSDRRKMLDVVIPFHQTVDVDKFVKRLNEDMDYGLDENVVHFIHIDIAFKIRERLDEFLFNLLILGSVSDSKGVIWRKQKTDFYAIECMPAIDKEGKCIHELFDLLPFKYCVSPNHVMKQPENILSEPDCFGLDLDEFRKEEWQRPIRFLACYHANDKKFKGVKNCIETSDKKALQLLISFCGLENPTWAELNNFVKLLNYQLERFEFSPHFSPHNEENIPDDLRQFIFVFLLQMSKDFATRSLRIAEESGTNTEEADGSFIEKMTLKRKWESSNLPYIFFHEDGSSITPVGVVLERSDTMKYKVKNAETGAELPDIELSPLSKSYLERSGILFNGNFADMDKYAMIRILRDIMVKKVHYQDPTVPGEIEDMFDRFDDPDESYALTVDNAKKMLAIHQRLRVDIPVVVMGETGCGKTMLLNFLSKLQIPTEMKEKKKGLKPMLTLKVHGGTTENEIMAAVNEAVTLADNNDRICKEYAASRGSSQVPMVYTLLFFDEANTTEAIGLIKEILCDRRMNGNSFKSSENLRIVAACNPYRRLNNEMIRKLNSAGLGYKVKDEETSDRFGNIPMRHLVYRVQPLPHSLHSLVWDFGKLTNERRYVRQMLHVKRFEELEKHKEPLVEFLLKSQEFMREQEDECSFVSLRDVQRFLDVTAWFYKQKDTILLPMNNDMKEDMNYQTEPIITSIILAAGVCYIAKLDDEKRTMYAKKVCEILSGIRNPDEFLLKFFDSCQTIFINSVMESCHKTHTRLAPNKALRENVFMMIVCIENRIPLFIVGKPGSSKSLAKNLVSDSMKGSLSSNAMLSKMKKTQMLSYQCSRHATSEGITQVFKKAEQQQRRQDIEKFAAVVVLDEVGLAEDSKDMPLKVLHPLLEDYDAEIVKKCAFIGFSNWALDPATMNRGIFVQRGDPTEDELKQIAKKICPAVTNSLIEELTAGYRRICKEKKLISREHTDFFSLRDFYSLMIMVADQSAMSDPPTISRYQVDFCIKRNFGGYSSSTSKAFDPTSLFSLSLLSKKGEKSHLPNKTIEMVKECLSLTEPGRRYLLLLVENSCIIPSLCDEIGKDQSVDVIFGNNFKEDDSYIQECQSISRIKHCAQMGRKVVLLNLDKLYESLYDLLDQYFSNLRGSRFVDIGLGDGHVKTKVDDKFRLIIIAEKNHVYKNFPIPLISRMEKHYVSASSLLTDQQDDIADHLTDWALSFSTQWEKKVTESRNIWSKDQMTLSNSFVGYEEQHMALVVCLASDLLLAERLDQQQEISAMELLDKCKGLLLNCLNIEALFRLPYTHLAAFEREIRERYLSSSYFSSLTSFVKTFKNGKMFYQITTFSTLLTESHIEQVRKELGLEYYVVSLHLQEFTKEKNFLSALQSFFQSDKQKKLLVLQCQATSDNQDFLTSVCLILQKEHSDLLESSDCKVVLLLSVSRGFSFTGYRGNKWGYAHIDDPRPEKRELTSLRLDGELPSLSECLKSSPSDILQNKSVLLKPWIISWVPRAFSRVKESSTDESEHSNESFDSEKNQVKINMAIFQEHLRTQAFMNTFMMCMNHIIRKGLSAGREEFEKFDNSRWLVEDVIVPSNMKHTRTIRHAIEDHLEKLFIPVMSEVITQLDYLRSLDTLSMTKSSDLWKKLFAEVNLSQTFKLMINKHLKVKLRYPFYWWLSDQFRKIISSKLICKEFSNSSQAGQKSLDLIDVKLARHYCHHFILFNHYCKDKDVLEILGEALYFTAFTSSEENDLISVHLIYEEMKETLSKLSDLFEFEILISKERMGIEDSKNQENFNRVVQNLESVFNDTPNDFFSKFEELRPSVKDVALDADQSFEWTKIRLRLLYVWPDKPPEKEFTKRLLNLNHKISERVVQHLESKFNENPTNFLETFERLSPLVKDLDFGAEQSWKWTNLCLRWLYVWSGLPQEQQFSNELLNNEAESLQQTEPFQRIVFFVVKNKQEETKLQRFSTNLLSDQMFFPNGLHDDLKGVIEYYPIFKDSVLVTTSVEQTVEQVLNNINKEIAPFFARLHENKKKLEAVKYLPDIISLIRRLGSEFNSQYTRDKVLNTSVETFRKSLLGKEDIITSVDNFIKAWNTIIANDEDGQTMDLREQSMCIFFLDEKHVNDLESISESNSPIRLVEEMVAIVNQITSCSMRDKKECETKDVCEVRKRHFVCLNAETDLKELVKRHCYTKDGKVNWMDIEQDAVRQYSLFKYQIKEIKWKDHLVYSYTEDLSSRSFLDMVKGITQETLADEEEHSVCEALLYPGKQKLMTFEKHLESAMNFMVNRKMPDTSLSLRCYLHEMLAYDASQYISDSVLLKHILRIWLLVKYQQAHNLMVDEKDPFDEKYPAFAANMSDLMKQEMSIDSTINNSVLKRLFKYIVMEGNRFVKDKDESFLNSVLRQELLRGESDAQLLAKYDSVLPDSILVKHAIPTWTHLWLETNKRRI